MPHPEILQYFDQGQPVEGWHYSTAYNWDSQYDYDPQEQSRHPPSPRPYPSPLNYSTSGIGSHSHTNHWHNKHRPYHGQPHRLSPSPEPQYVPGHRPSAPPAFEQPFDDNGAHYAYSDLHGKRKALLIGIDYFGGSAPSTKSTNEVHNLRDCLIQGYRFSAKDMWLMTDNSADARSIPTRQNVLMGMQWLAQGARPGDDLFLYFSGLSGPVRDMDGDEDDGYDEAIFPVDTETILNGRGYILNDLIFDICVRSLPQGCRLTVIFDCPHSGRIMNLPYMYSAMGVLKEPDLIRDSGISLHEIRKACQHGGGGSIAAGTADVLKRWGQTAANQRRRAKAAKTSAADVICFSTCQDSHRMAGVDIAAQGQGAISSAFRTSVAWFGHNLTYIQLLNSMQQALSSGGYSQRPQLSACHPIDLDLLFTL